jgi:hypothetical protein
MRWKVVERTVMVGGALLGCDAADWVLPKPQRRMGPISGGLSGVWLSDGAEVG